MLSSGFVYTAEIALFCIGFYGLIASADLLKKLISLSVMQVAVILMYLSVGYRGPVSVPPVYREASAIYANPVPQVLMLTAIVVGLAVTSIGFALCIRLKQSFGTRNARAIDNMCAHDRISISDGIRSKIPSSNLTKILSKKGPSSR